MPQLLIKKCSDPRYWYATLIGERVPLLWEDSEGYWSREPQGFTNVVRREDAEVITE